MKEFIYCAKAGCRTRADAATGFCPTHRIGGCGTKRECENKCENRLISVLMPHNVKV